MEATASKLVVQNLRKSFRTQRSEESIQGFEGISFEVHPSEFISLVGPSGCGKTTFLRILDGLIPHDDGDILHNGRTSFKPGPHRGVVSQQPPLLPRRTVMDNL